MNKFLALFVIFVASAQAEEFKWIGGEKGSWNSEKSFEPNGVPDGDDDVLLPANLVVKLNAADDTEWEAFNKIRRVRAADNCFLEVDVGDKNREMETAFTYQAQAGRNQGKLIKKGSGALWLKSMRDIYKDGSMYYDYYANYDIVEGSVGFNQEGITGISVKVGDLAISNNATFFTLPTAGDSLTYTYVMGLCGAPSALITNLAPIGKANNNVLRLSSNNRYSFAGKLVAPVRYFSHGSVDLTGTENTIISSFTQNDNKGRGFNGPYVGIASFGLSGKPSSIGLSGLVYSRESGAAFKYIGNGEETDVRLSVGSVANSPYPAFLSGGDNGGLIWGGIWEPYSTDNLLMQRLVIAGDGENVNVMKGVIKNVETSGGVTNSFFIRKQGRVIWRIEDSPDGYKVSSQMLGVWAVDEGTLQFTSLAEKGFVSSLGMATELYKDFCGVKDESKKISYALVLGGDSTMGTLEYVGTKDEYCSERNIWLYGDGAFINNGTSKIRFRGVSSIAEGESPSSRGVIFTVGGASTAENEILNITDSVERPVSVVKDGAGTWILGGEQSFRGKLDIKAGKLILRRPEKYTWFRWTLTSKDNQENFTNGNSDYYQMQEFALFDKDGIRQNCFLVTNSAYASLQPGQVAYGTDKIAKVSAADRDLHRLFDDVKDSASGDTYGWHALMRPPNDTSNLQKPVRDNRLSWIPIVMRLPDNANEIKSYDVLYYHASTHARSVTSYFVDGSVDGVNWDRLSTVDTVNVDDTNKWQYRGTKKDGEERNKPHEKGCEIDSAPKELFDVLNNVKSVSVDRGAELEFDGDIAIPALSFDYAVGGGTFTNCKFAEGNGFVDIVNADEAGVEIDFGWTFNGCTGVANIAQWGVKVDGVDSVRYSLAIKDGNRVVAVRPAMRIIIR